MLPPGDHQRACLVFCRILRRLEERDRRNGKIINIQDGAGRATDHHPSYGQEDTSNLGICPDLPASVNAGAEEERIG